MYLSTMDAVDILRLKKTELDACRKRITHSYEKLIRVAKKAIQAGKGISYSFYWKHPKSQSEYMLCFAVEDKRTLRNPPLFYLPIIRDKGINLAIPSMYLQEVVIFTPHFFDRYNERMNLNETNRLQLISDFIAKNWRFGERSVEKERKGNTEYELKLAEGAAMCNWDAKRSILYAKTFITDEMYYKKQRERLDNIDLHDIESLEAQDMRMVALAERGVL